MNIIEIIKREFKLIAIVFAAVLTITILNLALSKKIYRAEFVLKTSFDDINPLDAKSIEKDFSRVMADLPIDNMFSKNLDAKKLGLRSISTSFIKENYSSLLVNIEGTDSGHLKDLCNYLVTYINSLPVIQDKTKYQKELLEMYVTENTLLIKQLENTSRNNVLNVYYAPADFMKLKESLFSAQAQLKRPIGVYALTEPIIEEKPINKNWTLYLAIAIVLASILSIVLITIKYNSNKIL